MFKKVALVCEKLALHDFRMLTRPSSAHYSSKAAETKPKKPAYKLADLLTNPHPEKLKEVKAIDHVTNKELSFYDPPYLAREAPFPFYDTLRLSIKGYDFSVLDAYFEYMKRLCTQLRIETTGHAVPARTLSVKTLQLYGAGLDQEFNLKTYERVVVVNNLKSTLAPVLFEALQLNLPEGVSFKVGPLVEKEEEFRYIPDMDLKRLREELAELTKDRPH